MPVGLTVVHSRLLISFSRAGGRQRSTPRAPPRVQGWPDAGSMAARRRHWNPWDHWSAWDARAPRGAARLADGTGWRVQWRQPGQLGAGGDAELGEDLVEVVFDGPRADKQLRRDLPVGRPGGGQPGDLQLLRRELGERGRVSPPGGLTTGAQLGPGRSEEHTSELQSRGHLVCRLLLEKKKKKTKRQSLNQKKSPQKQQSIT